ncbi:NineTeen Complex (NTC) component [Parelaphostrongylus tenuis]|uniref:NineTeen Complex (NTC) component n=1 Tax=Parelaphostrongylus tenuis TaxID=148309 RepID=A0AAD5R9X5_PARTN|nr:NineTeen Complex (NTC) component [Parelaphostrongylus tenuis]
MARNAEKAMTALARWRRLKEEEEKGPIAKRPHDTSLCNNLTDAERFRREVIGTFTSLSLALIVVIANSF